MAVILNNANSSGVPLPASNAALSTVPLTLVADELNQLRAVNFARSQAPVDFESVFKLFSAPTGIKVQGATSAADQIGEGKLIVGNAVQAVSTSAVPSADRSLKFQSGFTAGTTSVPANVVTPEDSQSALNRLLLIQGRIANLPQTETAQSDVTAAGDSPSLEHGVGRHRTFRKEQAVAAELLSGSVPIEAINAVPLGLTAELNRPDAVNEALPNALPEEAATVKESAPVTVQVSEKGEVSSQPFVTRDSLDDGVPSNTPQPHASPSRKKSDSEVTDQSAPQSGVSVSGGILNSISAAVTSVIESNVSISSTPAVAGIGSSVGTSISPDVSNGVETVGNAPDAESRSILAGRQPHSQADGPAHQSIVDTAQLPVGANAVPSPSALSAVELSQLDSTGIETGTAIGATNLSLPVDRSATIGSVVSPVSVEKRGTGTEAKPKADTLNGSGNTVAETGQLVTAVDQAVAIRPDAASIAGATASILTSTARPTSGNSVSGVGLPSSSQRGSDRTRMSGRVETAPAQSQPDMSSLSDAEMQLIDQLLGPSDAPLMTNALGDPRPAIVAQRTISADDASADQDFGSTSAAAMTASGDSAIQELSASTASGEVSNRWSPRTLEQFTQLTMQQAAITDIGGRQRFQMRLEPAELGSVRIDIQRSADGKFQIHVSAESSETKSILENQVDSISQALNDQGISLSQFDVSQHSDGSSNPDHSQYVELMEEARLRSELRNPEMTKAAATTSSEQTEVNFIA